MMSASSDGTSKKPLRMPKLMAEKQYNFSNFQQNKKFSIDRPIRIPAPPMRRDYTVSMAQRGESFEDF